MKYSGPEHPWQEPEHSGQYQLQQDSSSSSLGHAHSYQAHDGGGAQQHLDPYAAFLNAAASAATAAAAAFAGGGCDACAGGDVDVGGWMGGACA